MIRKIGKMLGAILLLATLAAQSAGEQSPAEQSPEALQAGKMIALDRNAGNCASCHMFDDAELPGTSGPPLIQMQLRFPDRGKLRGQIWDASVVNPNTVMPPYGRHLILTEEELDLVVDYVHSL